MENYKSVQKLKLNPGRITVLIGENGCGKSNILEAIALASAAVENKLDNEFLASRGIRVTDPRLMRSAFDIENLDKQINISIETNNLETIDFNLQNENSPYSKWKYIKYEQMKGIIDPEYYKIIAETEVLKELKKIIDQGIVRENEKIKQEIYKKEKEIQKRVFQQIKKKTVISNFLMIAKFLIFSPENPCLRVFEEEGQIVPLGIRGEGLFKLLKVLNQESRDKIAEIRERLRLIDWFEGFDIPENPGSMERSIRLQDRYIDNTLDYFNQKSTNEGFLFLLFYFALFVSEDTPEFFAVDNIDASLNPKLCSRLVTELVELAKKYDKQAIFTTHNPAILDGLNLDDEEQRLFVVYRNKAGHTKLRRILKPETVEGQEPVKLSEAFLRGYIGGLPKNF